MKKIIEIITVILFILPVASQAETKTYIVKEGDTLSEICFKLMENGTYAVWRREAKRIGLKNPHRIFPGQVFNFQNVYRVEWESGYTGFTGFGKWSTDKQLISSSVAYANSQYPGIKHKLGVK
jgi:hypothetical protein